MDATYARRTLFSPGELRELTRKSSLRGAAQLASHVALIAVAGWLHALAMGSSWIIATGLLLGVSVNFLYAAQHELSHSTVFGSRALNEWVGRVVGFFMLFPRDYDQLMHFAHHRWTQDWKRDGELAREPYTLASYLLVLSGVGYWRNRCFGLVRCACGVVREPFVRDVERSRIVFEARAHVLGYMAIALASVYLQSYAALSFWLLPMLLTKPLHQLQNTMEHLGLGHERDTLTNTRTTSTNALVRWLCWQMPYHTAHHSFPAVPFWRLHELNDRIESAGVAINKMGYFEFQREVIRKLARKAEADYPMNAAWVVRHADQDAAVAGAVREQPSP